MDSPFIEQAIPMVAVDEHSGKYVLTNQAAKFLRAIQGPIAVVSVAGLYRTGKSYLLNRVLLNRSNGFGVGPTVNPCTKGLWCWGTPIKGTSSDGEPVNILVIDTEGIGALDEDTTHDTKIFTLAILASSCFIYNSVGSIDQNAIQNLSLVVNLTKHIQLKAAGGDEDGEDPDEISVYFPTFYWVVRDFSLQLQDPQGNQISPKEYLQKALAPQNGFSDDVEEKNRIRRLLTAFFKDRDCYTMIRPLVNEQKLQNLDKMDYDQLRPEFVHQAMSFRKRILSSVKVKALQNQKLNGDLYCSMMNSYVKAINEGAVPNIQNAWNYMCEQQCRKALDECYELFIKQMKEGFREFPKPEEEFNKCVNEAEDKALEAFREKALGDQAGPALKELKNRIRNQIAEVRDQNIKESYEQVRRFITSQVKPLTMKLNNQQFRSYSEFQKQIINLEERLEKDGPKLHNYKLTYLEAMRKLLAQGGDFLFKTFTKTQEKDREMFKLKEKQLQSQLETITQQKDTLRKEHMEFTTNSDQKIADLSYKIQTMTVQLNMTSQAKQQEEKKMERQFSTKYHEQQSNRKALDAKIKELMELMESNTKDFNNQKKQWQKDRAVLDQKNQFQTSQIEELAKNQKSEYANWNVEKSTLEGQLREMAQRHEKDREQLKLKLKQFEDLNNELQEELTSLKQQLEMTRTKLEKKEKKLKEETTGRREDIEKMKQEFELKVKQLKSELEAAKETVNKTSSMSEEKLKEVEKVLKETNNRLQKEISSLETSKALAEQKYQLLENEYEEAKKQHESKIFAFEAKQAALEQTYTQHNEETTIMRINQVRSEKEVEILTIRTEYENEKKRLSLEFNSLLKKNQEVEAQYQTLKMESMKKTFDLQTTVDQLNQQIKHLQDIKKTIVGEKDTEYYQKENRYKVIIRELENEIEEVKEKAEAEKAQHQKISEESISQIRNLCEMEKEGLQRRIRNQKQKWEKKYNALIEEHDRKLQEETEPLLNEIQELNDKMINLEEMMRNQGIHMQHQIDIKDKKIEGLEKAYAELKELFQRKEKELNIKYESFYTQAKAEKEKLESKVEILVNEGNKKDKELMSVTHSRDQLASTLDKKQNKLKELENEMQTQKQSLTEEKDKLHLKLSEMEKEHHEKMTKYEKENALLKQQNQFNLAKINELETSLATTNKIFEQKMMKYTEEREAEIKGLIEKLQTQKSSVESKFKDFKAKASDIESGLRKTAADLSKHNEVLEMKVANLQVRNKQLEQKRVEQMSALRTEYLSMKEANSIIKAKHEQETTDLRVRLQTLSSQHKALEQKYELLQCLSEQKIQFLENNKEDMKKNYDSTISGLLSRINILESSKSSEKSNIEIINKQLQINTEAKYNEKMKSLQEELSKKSSDSDALIKDKDNLIKELKEKYEAEKVSKETYMANMNKRISELIQSDRRNKEQIDRIKAEKDRKELQNRIKETKDKDNFKAKLTSLENKIKETEASKNKMVFELQKERVKWSSDRQNMNEAYSNLSQQVKKLELERDRAKVEVEKLKLEKKNPKTHSYISSLKPTYEPTKIYVEENNKENSHQQ